MRQAYATGRINQVTINGIYHIRHNNSVLTVKFSLTRDWIYTLDPLVFTNKAKPLEFNQYRYAALSFGINLQFSQHIPSLYCKWCIKYIGSKPKGHIIQLSDFAKGSQQRTDYSPMGSINHSTCFIGPGYHISIGKDQYILPLRPMVIVFILRRNTYSLRTHLRQKLPGCLGREA